MRFRDLPAGFHPNTALRCPSMAKGKRVSVILRSGIVTGTESITATSPPGWAADGPQGCRWSHSPDADPRAAFDIMGFKVL